MKLMAWGRYPVMDSVPLIYSDEKSLAAQIRKSAEGLIPYGNGRSYGDSALWQRFIPTLRLNRFLHFNPETGLLKCESGVFLSEILDCFLPKGWFPEITPGTKLITVGGAVASDVHGKNHHVKGCFSETVESLRLILPDGETITCSEKENREIFRATCGGMGLTGLILDVSFYLKKVKSRWINQKIIRCKNLQDTFESFKKVHDEPYSVAWIDCMQKGSGLGRSVIMAGDFAGEGDLDYKAPGSKTVPFDFPSFALNRFTVKAFNALYYAKAPSTEKQQRVSVESFFYPLDAINCWNRIYGKSGFTQYQFILPEERSYEGLGNILERISESGMGSFLAVLKLYGPANANYLSFPMKGYSLALDFRIEKRLFSVLDELDRLVVENGGRIYLTKDVRLKKDVFEQGYPDLHKFRSVRENVDPGRVFRSLQSERLGL